MCFFFTFGSCIGRIGHAFWVRGVDERERIENNTTTPQFCRAIVVVVVVFCYLFLSYLGFVFFCNPFDSVAGEPSATAVALA